MHSVKLLNNEALYLADYTPIIEIYVDGVLTAPTAATLSLFTPYNVEKVTDRICTISAAKKISAVFTGTGTTPEIDLLGVDYQLLLKYTIGGVVHITNFLFDNVRTPITCSVTDADLQKFIPELQGDKWDNQSTFVPQIERSFEDIKRKLKERGRRASMMIDGSQIRDLVIDHALEIIFFDFAKAPDDIWWIKYLKKAEKFQSDFENLHIAYDTDEGGGVDEVVFFGTSEVIR